MGDDFYTVFGYVAFWVMKYIFIPIGVGVAITVVAHKLLQPQPEGQKKRRLK
jgi:hypothetical protein